MHTTQPSRRATREVSNVWDQVHASGEALHVLRQCARGGIVSLPPVLWAAIRLALVAGEAPEVVAVREGVDVRVVQRVGRE